VAARFSVVRGDPMASLASGAEASDLVAVFESQGPLPGGGAASWASRVVSGLEGHTILYVADSVRPRSGPVLAVVSAHDAGSLASAARLASAANEELVIVDLDPDGRTGDWLEAALRDCGRSRADTYITAWRAPRSAIVDPEFAGLRARLVVLGRSAFEQLRLDLGDLVDGRGMPWLILGRGERPL
jgi:hypothetical protein